MAKPPNPEVWMRKVAGYMAQNQVSLKQAVTDLRLPILVEECEMISRKAEFKMILREERNRYHAEIANAPDYNKSSAEGMMMVAIENLMATGEYDKAVAAIEKLSKLRGWAGSDSNINIFAGLTAKDIAEQKERILKEIEQLRSTGPAEEVRPN